MITGGGVSKESQRNGAKGERAHGPGLWKEKGSLWPSISQDRTFPHWQPVLIESDVNIGTLQCANQRSQLAIKVTYIKLSRRQNFLISWQKEIGEKKYRSNHAGI